MVNEIQYNELHKVRKLLKNKFKFKLKTVASIRIMSVLIFAGKVIEGDRTQRKASQQVEKRKREFEEPVKREPAEEQKIESHVEGFERKERKSSTK